MADVGTYGHTLVPAAPSWSADAAEVLGEQLGEQLGREREHEERVMVVYSSGTELPGSVIETTAPRAPGHVLVLIDMPGCDLLGWWPSTMLRTLVHEQCVPAELIG